MGDQGSIPGRGRKKQVVTALLPNARQQSVSVTVIVMTIDRCPVSQWMWPA